MDNAVTAPIRPGPFPWYRGWTMAMVGIVMVMLSIGSVTYGYSIYVAPVSDDLGLSREAINGGIAVQHLGTALLTPFVGRLLDRFKVSTIVMYASVALGGSLIALGIGDALWPKALILFLPLSFGFQGAGTIASYVLMARWFRMHRGRAMALVALGQSFGSVAFAPLLGMMIEAVGWRQSLLWQGLLVGGLLFVVSRLIVDHPQEGEAEPPGRSNATARSTYNHSAEPIALKSLLVRIEFWMMAATIALTLSVVQAMIASLVPMATGRDIALVQATTLLSALGISALAGKVVLAVIADRVDRALLVACAIAIILMVAVGLIFLDSYAGMVGMCLLGGMAMGGFFPLYSALIADRFGPASLGTAEGLMSPLVAGSSAVAIWFAGRSFDATGDYGQTLAIFSGSLTLALLLALLRRFVIADTPPGGVAT